MLICSTRAERAALRNDNVTLVRASWTRVLAATVSRGAAKVQTGVHTSHVDVVILGEVTHCEVGVVMIFVNEFLVAKIVEEWWCCNGWIWWHLKWLCRRRSSRSEEALRVSGSSYPGGARRSRKEYKVIR